MEHPRSQHDREVIQHLGRLRADEAGGGAHDLVPRDQKKSERRGFRVVVSRLGNGPISG